MLISHECEERRAWTKEADEKDRALNCVLVATESEFLVRYQAVDLLAASSL